MKYAKWSVYFETPGSKDGTTPEDFIRSQNKYIGPAFFTDSFTFVSYIGDDVTEEGLDLWNFKVIPQNEALDLALAKNPNSYLAEDGAIAMPFDDPYISSR